VALSKDRARIKFFVYPLNTRTDGHKRAGYGIIAGFPTLVNPLFLFPKEKGGKKKTYFSFSKEK